MPQKDVTAWLQRAIGELPLVTANPDQLGGTEYQIGDVSLGYVHPHGTVDLEAGQQLTELAVGNGWATPSAPGRLTVDLSQPQGGTVALWLLCRNYRRASTVLAAAASPNGATAHASFEAAGTPPLIRILDEVGTSSLRSSQPGP